MKKYKVIVDGNKEYEIEIELSNETLTVPAAPKAEKVSAAAPAEAPKAAPAPAAGNGTAIKAPLPGNILKVYAEQGKSYKKGDTLMILEAMKMENEIVAPSDCTVTSVMVTKGASVETNTVLCTIA